MPKNPHANFTPALEGYSGQDKFRFWCQLALPLTYDDSLSYYELLCKVVNYLNNTIEDVADVETNVSRLAEAYTQLQNYVNDYFDDLDVEAELRNVLDAMAEDGTLDDLLDPLVQDHLPSIVDEQIDDVVADQIDDAVAGQIDDVVAEQLPPLVEEGIPDEVSDWLTENVDPVGSAVVVDSSLTISGAAADAKVTGDELADLKTHLTVPSRNILDCTFTDSLIDANGVYSDNTTGKTYTAEEEFIPVDPSTDYTMSGDAPSVSFQLYYFQYTENKTFISRNYYTYTDESATGRTITTEANTAYMRFMGYKNNADWDSFMPEKLQFEKGDTATPYVAPAYVINTNAINMPELESVLENYFDKKYNFRTCYIVPSATSTHNYKITINESSITIPTYTRIFYDNDKTFRTSGNTTVNRIAYGSSAENNEILVFDTSNNTFRFVAGSAYDALTDTDRIAAVFKYGMNGCTLPESFVVWNGVPVENKIGFVALPAASYLNAKIKVNKETIVLPRYFRVLYGKSQEYSLSSEVTVNRVAYGSSGANNEVLLFNTSTKAFRCINGNMTTVINENEVILATFKWELNGCSLSSDFVEYSNEPEIIKLNSDAGNKLYNTSIVLESDEGKTLAQRNDLLNLIHFSDIHGGTAYIQRILDFYNVYGDLIHDIIHTGDGVTNHFEDADPFATVGGDTILNIVGNHEYWKTGSTWPHPYDATQAEVYEKFIAPYISNWSGVVPAGTNKNYYYKDYSTAKIRMIILDSINYDSTQATWFAGILSDAITNNLKVICVTHYPPQPGITPIDCNFTTSETLPGPQSDPAEGAQIEFMPTAAYQAVDNFIDGGGDFVCWLCGHMHKDAIGKVTGFTEQLLVFVSTGNPGFNADVVARNTGTKLADLFNIFSFDGVANTIKIIRVGADYDKFLRHRGTITINYKTQTIVNSN